MEPRLHVSPEQYAVLIKFMERHGDLARHRVGVSGQIRNNHMWSELTYLVNSVTGGLVKPIGEWQKVWDDWKTTIKYKLVDIKKYATSTDGGPRPSLTTLEERVVAVMGVTALEEKPYVLEHGFHTSAHVLEAGYGEVDQINLVPNSPPAMPLPLPSPQFPPSPSSSLPVFSTSPLPSPPSPRQSQRQPRIARQNSGPPRRYLMSERSRARRNRHVTHFDRAMRIFADFEKHRLNVEECKLALENRRLDLENRRRNFEEARDRRSRELQIGLLRILNTRLINSLIG